MVGAVRAGSLQPCVRRRANVADDSDVAQALVETSSWPTHIAYAVWDTAPAAASEARAAGAASRRARPEAASPYHVRSTAIEHIAISRAAGSDSTGTGH